MTTATTKTEHMRCAEYYVSRRKTAIGSITHTACPWWTFSVLYLLLRYLCQALVWGIYTLITSLNFSQFVAA